MSTSNKNKTVKWPSSLFFDFKTDMVNENPLFIDITLRTRLMQAIKDGKVAEVGSVAGSHGRPRKMYALTPVTSETLDKAEADGITLVDKAREKFAGVSMNLGSNKTSPVVVTNTTTVTA